MLVADFEHRVSDLLAFPLADPPPIATLVRRNRNRRLRRRAGLLSAVATVAAIALVFTIQRGEPNATVRTVRPPSPTPTTLAVPAIGTAPRIDSSPVPDAPRRGIVSVTPSPSTTATTVGGSAPRPREYPNFYTESKTNECVATDGPSAGMGQPYEAQPSRCQFHATSDGGYQGTGWWSIWIDRGGRRLYFDNRTSPSCANRGFIRAGDTVMVSIGRNDDEPHPDVAQHNRLAAGGQFHC